LNPDLSGLRHIPSGELLEIRELSQRRRRRRSLSHRLPDQNQRRAEKKQ
jgi:hypothetical protein